MSINNYLQVYLTGIKVADLLTFFMSAYRFCGFDVQQSLSCITEMSDRALSSQDVRPVTKTWEKAKQKPMQRMF